MLSWLAAVGQDVSVVGACVFQSISQHCQAVVVQSARRKGPIVVGGLSEGQHGWRKPGGIDREGAERVAKEVTENKWSILASELGTGTPRVRPFYLDQSGLVVATATGEAKDR
jgi:hypothetical protein